MLWGVSCLYTKRCYHLKEGYGFEGIILTQIISDTQIHTDTHTYKRIFTHTDTHTHTHTHTHTQTHTHTHTCTLRWSQFYLGCAAVVVVHDVLEVVDNGPSLCHAGAPPLHNGQVIKDE